MDKYLTKLLLVSQGIPTPRWWVLADGESCRGLVPAELDRLVGKPVDQGSSVGVRIVNNDDAGWRELEEIARQYRRILVEEYIAGKEVTAAVVGPTEDPVALPLVMIDPSRSFYDYTAKYTSGVTEYICPAPVEDGLAAKVKREAQVIYTLLDLEPYARIDCMVADSGKHYFLEANTLPGFTVHSLLPKAARAAGLDFTGLLEFLLCAAIERHEREGFR